MNDGSGNGKILVTHAVFLFTIIKTKKLRKVNLNEVKLSPSMEFLSFRWSFLKLIAGFFQKISKMKRIFKNATINFFSDFSVKIANLIKRIKIILTMIFWSSRQRIKFYLSSIFSLHRKRKTLLPECKTINKNIWLLAKPLGNWNKKIEASGPFLAPIIWLLFFLFLAPGVYSISDKFLFLFSILTLSCTKIARVQNFFFFFATIN